MLKADKVCDCSLVIYCFYGAEAFPIICVVYWEYSSMMRYFGTSVSCPLLPPPEMQGDKP